MRPERRIAAALFTGAVLLVGIPARADQPTESRDLAPLERARIAFSAALDMEKAGNWAGALEALEGVAAVRRTPQVEYHIALCLKNLGKPVEAARGFRQALEAAKAEGNADEVLENVPAQLEELAPSLGHLRLVVNGHGRFRVRLDGPLVPLAELDEPILVAPGRHVVAIEVTDARGVIHTQKKQVDVAAGETATVELSIVERTQPASPGRAPVAEPPGEGAKPRPSPTESEPVRWPAYLSFGVAGGFTVLTGVFIGLRQDAVDTVTASCADPEALTGCDPALRDTAERGAAFQGAAIGFGIATLAAVGTGIGLWIALTPSGDDRPQSALWLGPSTAGIRASF